MAGHLAIFDASHIFLGPSSAIIREATFPNIMLTFSNLSLLVMLVLGAIVLTRVLTDSAWTKNTNCSHTAIPMPPYWIPFLGHVTCVTDVDGFLRRSRARALNGIFSLKLFGTIHHMIFSPSLTQAIFSQRPDVLDFHAVVWHILHNVGGLAHRWKDSYDAAFPALAHPLNTVLMREPGVGKMISITVRNMQDTLPTLISFASRPIDQHVWEQKANPCSSTTADGRPAVEVDLLKLVLDYVGIQALPSIFGTDYLRNNPTTFTDLWEFNDCFLLLAAGLPRWLPYPKLKRAFAARDRLAVALTEFEKAMDAHVAGETMPSKWEKMDQISQVMYDRRAAYASQNIPPHIRAPGEISILWALNANSNYIVFWLLARILSTPGLVQQLRAETCPYIQLSLMTNNFRVSESPSIQIDHKGITNACPLLKSCYVESLRLDSAPWSLKKVKKDFSITESVHDAIPGHKPCSFTLKAGTFAEVPLDLHFTDPRYFPDPMTFVSDRHIVQSAPDEDGFCKRTAEWGSVRPFGGGAHMCKGRNLAEKEVLVTVAGMLALWDIEPIAGEWKLPGHGKATGVSMPLGDIRVRFSRRKSLDARDHCIRMK